MVNIVPDDIRNAFHKRNKALFGPLAAHQDYVFGKIEVVGGEPQQFRDAQSRAVKEFKHCPVASLQHGCVGQSIQKSQHGLHIQEIRQMLAQLYLGH